MSPSDKTPEEESEEPSVKETEGTDENSSEESESDAEGNDEASGSDEIISDEEQAALREQNGDDAEGMPIPEGSIRELHADHWEQIVSDQIPALESISERMVSLLKTTARKYFRTTVEVTAQRSSSQRWGAYARRLPVPVSLNVIHVTTLDRKGVICLEQDFVYTLVDIFFGGNGTGTRPIEHVEFTPMELRLIEQFIDAVMEDMKQAWRPFMDLSITAKGVETNPVFASVAAGGDTVSVSGFTFQLGEKELSMEIVLPVAVVEPIRFLRDSASPEGKTADSTKWKRRLHEDMQDADIVLRATLAEMPISLRDIVTAKAGDVIQTEIPKIATICVGEQPLMTGTFGVSKGKNAVCIDESFNRRLLGERNGRR